MHDPMVVAWSIPRPWPKISKRKRDTKRLWYMRYEWAKWYKPWEGWRKFWRFGNIEVYWPDIITIWHNEPNGHDSGEVCKHYTRWQDDHGVWHGKPKRAWRYHIHHWSIQIRPLQKFSRWAFTRCEWCGGRSRKGDMVNVSKQWDRDKTPWWRGERGLFHSDCSSISTAHRVCVCGVGPWGQNDHGQCVNCNKYRVWRSKDNALREALRDVTNAMLASIPQGQRDPEVTANVRRLWAEYRGNKT